MTIAAIAATPTGTTDRHGSRKHQIRNSRVGQIARPTPKLNEVTNPAHTTIRVADDKPGEPAFIAERRRNARAVLAISREHMQLNPPTG
jgi:hypothetical protein